MAETIIASVRPGSREVIGGDGLAYEFLADLHPDLLGQVLDGEDAPTDPGVWVWRGSSLIGGVPPDFEITFRGAWRRARTLDLLLIDQKHWN